MRQRDTSRSLLLAALVACSLGCCTALPAQRLGIQSLRGGGWKPPHIGISRGQASGGKVVEAAGDGGSRKGSKTAGQQGTRRGNLAGVTVVAMVYFLSVALAIPALPKLVNTVVGDSRGRASGSSLSPALDPRLAKMTMTFALLLSTPPCNCTSHAMDESSRKSPTA